MFLMVVMKIVPTYKLLTDMMELTNNFIFIMLMMRVILDQYIQIQECLICLYQIIM